MNNPFALLIEPELVLTEVNDFLKIKGRIYSPLSSPVRRVSQEVMPKPEKKKISPRVFEIPDIGIFQHKHFFPFCSNHSFSASQWCLNKGLRQLKQLGTLPLFWPQVLWCLKHQPKLATRALQVVNNQEDILTVGSIWDKNNLEIEDLAYLLAVRRRFISSCLKRDGFKVRKRRMFKIVLAMLSFGETETIHQLKACREVTSYVNLSDYRSRQKKKARF